MKTLSPKKVLYNECIEKFSSINSIEQICNYIKHNLKCPFLNYDGEKYNLIRDELYQLWKNIAIKFMVNTESRYMYDDEEEVDFQLGKDDLEELKPIAINICTWIKEAKSF